MLNMVVVRDIFSFGSAISSVLPSPMRASLLWSMFRLGVLEHHGLFLSL